MQDRLFTPAKGKKVNVDSIGTGNLLKTLEGHSDVVNDVSANQSVIATCSFDKTVRIFDINTFEHVKTIEAHSG